jgi:hypothetical protein
MHPPVPIVRLLCKEVTVGNPATDNLRRSRFFISGAHNTNENYVMSLFDSSPVRICYYSSLSPYVEFNRTCLVCKYINYRHAAVIISAAMRTPRVTLRTNEYLIT